VAPIETTSANFGRIHAQLVDWRFSRSTMSDPPSRALGPACLAGEVTVNAVDAICQIENCSGSWLPSRGAANSDHLRWFFRVVCTIGTYEQELAMSQVLWKGNGSPTSYGDY
jgi:hypothetical protein